jgi:CheY-like chemotaxis protein
MILVADDDHASRSLIVSLLRTLDFRVHALADGEAALRATRELRPDLIVTDLAMPAMNGLEVARGVRGDESLAKLPIVAVSASASRITRDQALQAGCSAFVEKPLQLDELVEVIGPLLGITWRYETAGGAGMTAVAGGVAAAREPNPAIIEELLECARRGDITRLLVRVREAEGSDPSGSAIYGEVRRLAATFDMKNIRRVLEEGRA